MVIERPTVFHGDMAKLGTQVPASHYNAGFVDFEPVLIRKSFRDLPGDFKIARQFIGRGTLCNRNQPSCISHEYGVTHRRGFPSVSYTHLRAHETPEHLVCRL